MATPRSQPLATETVDLQQLPDDPATLKGMIVELVQTLRNQERHAEHLQTRLDQLLHRLYGRRSERFDPAQLLLMFSDAEQTNPVPPAAANKPSAEEAAGSRRSRRPGAHGRQRLPEELRRQTIRHELTEAERNCPCCGQQRTAISEEVSEQVEYVPASVLVHQRVRVTYVCHSCQQHPLQAPRQENPLVTAKPDEAVADPTVPVPAQVGGNLGVASVDVTRPDSDKTGAAGVDHEESLESGVAQSRDAAATTAPAVQSTAATSASTDATRPVPPVRPASTASNDSGVVKTRWCSTFITAPLPPEAIPGCLAGPGLLAHVIVNKFVDHLPLYRQEQQFLRQGIWLSRRTLSDWLAGCARAFQPLFALMWERVFRSRNLHTDDTPVSVQGQRGKGHLWVYVGDWYHPYVVYDFTPNRREDRPLACLSAFRGYLHADAYSVYDKTFGKDRIEVACWAHARRYFWDARLTDPVRACCVLSLIGQLYSLEAAAKYAWQAADLPVEEYWDVRRQLRQRQAVPVLDRLQEYLSVQQAQVLPRSPIGEAFTYLGNQWTALRRYTEHGFLDLDNNVGEQALRGIGIGRKNWLFLGSKEGGQTAATLYSLVQTCKRHGVDPWYYLREMLTILPTLTGQTRATELPNLLPDEWARLQCQRHTAPP